MSWWNFQNAQQAAIFNFIFSRKIHSKCRRLFLTFNYFFIIIIFNFHRYNIDDHTMTIFNLYNNNNNQAYISTAFIFDDAKSFFSTWLSLSSLMWLFSHHFRFFLLPFLIPHHWPTLNDAWWLAIRYDAKWSLWMCPILLPHTQHTHTNKAILQVNYDLFSHHHEQTYLEIFKFVWMEWIRLDWIGNVFFRW